jgi:hypothetical protein
MIQGVLCGQDRAGKKDSLKDVTVEFWTRNRLIIIPVMINDTLRVNLAIDPHCRTIVLFGKRFSKLLREARTDAGELSASGDRYDISIGPVKRHDVPILVVPNSDPVNFFTSVNGIIGMQHFAGFELIMNRRKQTLTLKPAQGNVQHAAMISYPGSIWDKFIFH